jgi:hypothetical protein
MKDRETIKMRIWMNLAVAAAAVGASAMTLLAQWPDYPTAGPRTPEGKIDLKGPAPRTATGKPDFSGLWEQADSKKVSFNGMPPLPFEIPSAPSDPPVAQFFNIGAGSKRACRSSTTFRG